MLVGVAAEEPRPTRTDRYALGERGRDSIPQARRGSEREIIIGREVGALSGQEPADTMLVRQLRQIGAMG